MHRLPVYTPRPLAWETTHPGQHDPGCTACSRSRSDGYTARTRCMMPGQRRGAGRRVLVIFSAVDHVDAAAGQIGTEGASGWLYQALLHAFEPDAYIMIDAALRCAGEDDSFKEVEACRTYTAGVIRTFRPDLIVVCGDQALTSVTGDRKIDVRAIARGWAIDSAGRPVVVMLDHHAAFANSFVQARFLDDLAWLAAATPDAFAVEDDWQRVLVTPENVTDAIADLRASEWVSWDIEYAGVPFDGDGYFEVLTQGLAGSESRIVWVWELSALRNSTTSTPLYTLLEDPEVAKVAQNGKVDVVGMIAREPTTGRASVLPRNLVLDPLLASHLQDPDVQGDLLTLSYRVGRGRTKGVLEEQLDTAHTWITHVRAKAKTGSFLPGLLHPAYDAAVRHPSRNYKAFAHALVNPTLLAEYQATDTATTATLGRKLAAEINADPVTREGWKIMRPLPEIAARMEAAGVGIDLQRLSAFEAHLRVQQHRHSRELLMATGGRVLNVNAPADVADYLFGTLHLPVLETTKTGAPSVEAEVLEKLASMHPHPAIPLIAALKVTTNYLSKYAEGMRRHVRGDSRVHPSFNLDGTRTGRWSSSDPNFQNLAEHDALAQWVKRYLVARPGYSILAYDFSQVEYLMAAVVSGDPVMQQIFKDGKDMHRRTAELIAPTLWKIPTATMEAMSASEIKSHRQQAKAVNFGALFNMQASTLARQLGCSDQEASKLLKAILTDLFPTFAAWRDNEIQTAIRTGMSYVYSVSEAGDLIPIRRRPLVGIGSQNRRAVGNAINASVNTPVQGSASVVQAKAITSIDNYLMTSGLYMRGFAQIINAIHDATYLEVHNSVVAEVHAEVSHRMVTQPTRGVPLRVEGKAGPDLASLIPIEDWIQQHAA